MPGDPMTWKNLAIKLFKLNIFIEEFPEEEPFRSWRTPGYSFYLSMLMHFGIFNVYVVFYEYFFPTSKSIVN